MAKRKRQNRGLAIAGYVAACVGVLLLAVMTYTAFFADRLLPEGLPYQWSPVNQTDMGQALPEGALAVVDKQLYPSEREVGAYRDEEGRMVFGRVAKEEVNQLVLTADQGEASATVERSAMEGAVHLYVAGLGAVVELLHTYRLTVAAVAVLYLALLLVLVCTRGTRQRSRKRRELIELFAFYGDKYDLEETGIDY